jgi:hypothetical protein
MVADGMIRRGQSCALDAREAAREFHAAVAQDDPAIVLFFCSSEYDLEALADEMGRLFAGVPLVGCTSAGEIGPAGYRDRSLTGMSFPASTCAAVVASLGNLQRFSTAEGEALAHGLLRELEALAPKEGPRESFALMLIDGLSIREEQVARAFQNGLGTIRLFGGSAGDDTKFERTFLFYEGAFRTDAAVLILFGTSLPFRIFRTQHFVCENERLVVTEADTARRIVKEINGLPAAAEYARLVGVTVAELRPALFAASPVVVVIDGTDYVRAIQKVNEDGSLTFFSAIDEGLVFRVARGVDLIANLNRAFEDLRAQIGPPQLIIACDCILRNLEITQNGLKETVGEIMRSNAAVGFSTYGEQIDGVHVNQTLTGIAIGYPGE